MLGSFTFILHTHLPYVLHHGKWPHGSDWLTEAVAECYLPILSTLETLGAEGLAPRITMDFSPINLEQMADPAFKDVFLDYCKEKIDAATADYAYFEQNNEKHFQPLAIYWKKFYEDKKRQFEEYNFDVVGAFRRLSDAGILDAMTCGATHGYFPLLLRDDNIRAQMKCAIASHEKHFGKRPRGIWLPECGYRPRYKWSPPVGPEKYRKQSEERAGIEELVSEVGLEYFVVDGALTRGGMTIPKYHPWARKVHERYLGEIGTGTERGFETDPHRSLAEIYWVNSSNRDLPGRTPAVFSRDPLSSSIVWSADLGYPGAGVYLDFHKKHHNSGLRYWKVTGSKVDLGDKQQYDPSQTDWQLDFDAGNFVSVIRRELADHQKEHGTAGVLAEPFDTELFGHWWFEGPRFLEKVMRRLKADQGAAVGANHADIIHAEILHEEILQADTPHAEIFHEEILQADTLHKDALNQKRIKLTDCAEALDNYNAPHVTISLPEGSWGEGGHHYVWTNKEVAWMWDVIYPLEDKFLQVLKKLKSGNDLAENDLLLTIMEQAARELLLLEASDWEFVISTQGAIEYSKMRFGRHAELLTRLLEMAEGYDAGEGIDEDEAEVLQEALIVDRPFSEIDLAWWDSPKK